MSNFETSSSSALKHEHRMYVREGNDGVPQFSGDGKTWHGFRLHAGINSIEDAVKAFKVPVIRCNAEGTPVKNWKVRFDIDGTIAYDNTDVIVLKLPAGFNDLELIEDRVDQLSKQRYGKAAIVEFENQPEPK